MKNFYRTSYGCHVDDMNSVLNQAWSTLSQKKDAWKDSVWKAFALAFGNEA